MPSLPVAVSYTHLDVYKRQQGERAQIRIGGESSSCIAVAYQGVSGREKVEYVLVFEVPGSVTEEDALELQVPGEDWISLK